MTQVTKVRPKTRTKQAKAKGERVEPRHTRNIKFLGVGVNEDDERFL